MQPDPSAPAPRRGPARLSDLGAGGGTPRPVRGAPGAGGLTPGPQEVGVDRMVLHLAGCTARDEAALHAAPGLGARWKSGAPRAWRGAGLSAWKVQCLEELRDGVRAGRELVALAELGVRLVQHDGPDYPEALHHLYQPPLLLAVRGRWPVALPAVAVVGARAATPYGQQATRLLAAALAAAGFAVVSGLARGVDRCALESALAHDGCAVGVLGTGIDLAYPPEHRGLQETIAGRGTILSEFPLGRRPDKLAFPRRNRVIAALARQVLVVEAGARSGALITAAHAVEIGRSVLAVPGPIDSEQSAGTNRLIVDGALPIVDVAELMLAVGGPVPAGPARQRPADPLLAALGARTLAIDELAQASGRSAQQVLSGVVALELQGLLQRVPGGRFAARTPGATDLLQR